MQSQVAYHSYVQQQVLDDKKPANNEDCLQEIDQGIESSCTKLWVIISSARACHYVIPGVIAIVGVLLRHC
eukprot:scaffold138900_cov52-Attheya_sp.AAC.1